MFEISLYNRLHHLQQKWDGAPLRVCNRAGTRHDEIVVRSEESHCIDFQIATLPAASDKGISIHNHGLSLVLPGGQRIAAGSTGELAMPVQFWVGLTQVSILSACDSHDGDGSLVSFPSADDDPATRAELLKKLGGAPAATTLAHWFDALRRLQQSPPGTAEFYTAAAFAMFDPAGLDAGLALLRGGDEWRIAGSHVACPGWPSVFRRDLLERSLIEQRTLFHDARLVAAGDHRPGYGFAVVSPITGPSGSIEGFLYGIRHDYPQNQRRGIRPLEAQFVQAIADAVSAGLGRLARESEVAKLRIRLEQTFPPTVARELERNPQLLSGDQREVTVLFADLRGSTSLAEQLSSRALHQLLGDVLDRLTAVVMRYEGVVIDYYGDGLAAFWNAPVAQPDHARLACFAARDMQRELADISSDWQGLTGRRLRLGIGVHTGSALVGNSGSRWRIKYGPRGPAVNLASRIENATKAIGLSTLISAETARRIQSEVPVRRVFRWMCEGFENAVDLYESLLENAPDRKHLAAFEKALAAFDAADYVATEMHLASLRDSGIADPAVDFLSARVREQLKCRSHPATGSAGTL